MLSGKAGYKLHTQRGKENTYARKKERKQNTRLLAAIVKRLRVIFFV